MGVSRSPSLVIAILIRKFDMSLKDALKLVERKREVINVRVFMDQLEFYETGKVLKRKPRAAAVKSMYYKRKMTT